MWSDIMAEKAKRILWRGADTGNKTDGVTLLYPDGKAVDYPMPLPSDPKIADLTRRGWFEKAKDCWAGNDAASWDAKRALVQKGYTNWLAGVRASTNINVEVLLACIMDADEDGKLDAAKVQARIEGWKKADMQAFFLKMPDIGKQYMARTAGTDAGTLEDMFND